MRIEKMMAFTCLLSVKGHLTLLNVGDSSGAKQSVALPMTTTFALAAALWWDRQQARTIP